MPIRPWPRDEEELIADMKIFRVLRARSQSPRTGVDRDIAVVETGDWVNIVALTRASEVVLVRQYRHGTQEITREIPGGLIDPGEEPAAAATRELREETGYVGDTPELLGTVAPNPAFLNNACHTYLIRNCTREHELALDDGEDIEVETLALADVPGEIAAGRIDHALVICGFWWLGLRERGLFAVM